MSWKCAKGHNNMDDENGCQQCCSINSQKEVRCSVKAFQVAKDLELQICQQFGVFVEERAAELIDKALDEREAQAVQREREAAKGLIHHIHSCVLQAMGRRDNFAILNDLSNELATYNDNRKG